MDKLKLAVMENYYRSKKVATIVASYAGSGDSGGLDSDPEFQNKKGKTIKGLSEDSTENGKVAYDILEELLSEEMDKHEGFEINDGGGGEIIITITASGLKISHEAYYYKLEKTPFTITDPEEEEVP